MPEHKNAIQLRAARQKTMPCPVDGDGDPASRAKEKGAASLQPLLVTGAPDRGFSESGQIRRDAGKVIRVSGRVR